MTIEHTTGPWISDEWNIRNEDGLDVATVDTERSTDRSTEDAIPEREWVCNARLISAAPDLLAALQAVADYWEGGDIPADIDAAMRAALKKAKGTQ